MAIIKVASPMAINGAAGTPEERLKMGQLAFAGEVFAAFEKASLTRGKMTERTIESGTGARFPVFGRAEAHFLQPGQNLDDIRGDINQGQRTISIDGVLTSDVLIFDMDQAMADYNFRSVYVKELGNALATSYDCSVFAEVAKEAMNPNENVTGNGKGGVIETKVSSGAVDINRETGIAIYQTLLKAKAKMGKNFVPHQDRMAFLEPEMHAALASAVDLLNRDYGAGGTITEGNVLRLAGFDVFEAPELTRGGSDPTHALDKKGHVFPAEYADKHPILMCHQRSVGVVKLADMSIETDRRIEYQGTHTVARMMCGFGGLQPECSFIGIIKDAS